MRSSCEQPGRTRGTDHQAEHQQGPDDGDRHRRRHRNDDEEAHLHALGRRPRAPRATSGTTEASRSGRYKTATAAMHSHAEHGRSTSTWLVLTPSTSPKSRAIDRRRVLLAPAQEQCPEAEHEHERERRHGVVTAPLAQKADGEGAHDGEGPEAGKGADPDQGSAGGSGETGLGNGVGHEGRAL